MNIVKSFYNQYVMREDKLFVGLLLVLTILGLAYVLGNLLTYHYPSNGYPWRWFLQMPIFLGLGIFALYARKHSPRMAFLTWTYCLYFLMVITISVITLGLETTPFPVIDPWLVKVDQLLGFHQLAVLNWTYAHHWILKSFNFSYAMLDVELGLFPFILALMFQKKAVKVYLLALIFSTLIGFSIFYFFPTTAPASMFFDSHFTLQQHDTFIKFFEIHHYLPVTTSDGGLIAFPSFHVIWAVLLAYSFKDKKTLFFPIALFNIIIIASTVFLGWHYLTDVIAGLALSALAIWIAEVVYKRHLAGSTQCVRNEKRTKIKKFDWAKSPLVAHYRVTSRREYKFI